MILEVAMLNVRAGQNKAFEQAFALAESIISAMDGYVSHQLQRCLESPDKYLLLVNWRRLENHTIGFRQSCRVSRMAAATTPLLRSLSHRGTL